MKIWQIKPLSGEYESLQLVNFEEDYVKYFEKKFIDKFKLEHLWGDIKVYVIEEGKESDCPYFYGSQRVHVFSKKAVNLLEKYLKDMVEFLPIICDKKIYYAVHVLNVIDVIDYKKAEIKMLKSGLKVGLKKYAFLPNMIKDQHIFRTYFYGKPSSRVFVSDHFKEKVLNSELKGFEFVEVWDSEKEV